LSAIFDFQGGIATLCVQGWCVSKKSKKPEKPKKIFFREKICPWKSYGKIRISDFSLKKCIFSVKNADFTS